ncbi:hypothetical protein AMTRI_Chr02g216170 [Amborella trichopoda]
MDGLELKILPFRANFSHSNVSLCFMFIKRNRAILSMLLMLTRSKTFAVNRTLVLCNLESLYHSLGGSGWRAIQTDSSDTKESPSTHMHSLSGPSRISSLQTDCSTVSQVKNKQKTSI